MGKLTNDITINAPIDKIWNILTDLELLDKTDPTVKKATFRRWCSCRWPGSKAITNNQQDTKNK